MLTIAPTPRDKFLLAALPGVAALLIFVFHLQPRLARHAELREQHDSLPPPEVIQSDLETAAARIRHAQSDLETRRADLDARRADLPASLPPETPPPPLDRIHAFDALCATHGIQILAAERAPSPSPDALPVPIAPPATRHSSLVTPPPAALPSDAALWTYTLLAAYPQVAALLADNADAPAYALPVSLSILTPPAPAQPARWSLSIWL